jgi:hypothetical protein
MMGFWASKFWEPMSSCWYGSIDSQNWTVCCNWPDGCIGTPNWSHTITYVFTSSEFCETVL